MNIETVTISDLKVSEVTVRKHPEIQIKELSRAVKMFGQTRPLVIDEDNVVLAGNGLLDACKRLNYDTIKAYRISNLSQENKYKLMIADNKIFSLGYDDYTTINALLKDFTDFDVPGFDEGFLRDITKSLEELTIPDLSETNNSMRKNNIKFRTARKQKTEIVCPKCGEIIER
ncbi:MAG: ParB/Srx family N-terminal domain-containing protein [Candidatus Cloacimonetes bacterium]|nr:ParB/Srx family N-terminal domain-containing protein [Candidatus Cloacimonadota bacterium]